MFETGDYKVSARTESTGWALCDGTAYEQSAQPDLYAVIGDAYNSADTPTGFFCVPDLRGRVLVGASATYPLGASFGADEVALSAEQMPPHRHSLNVFNSQGSQLNPAGNYIAGCKTNRSTGGPVYDTLYVNESTYVEAPQHQGTAHAETIAESGGAIVNGDRVAQPVSVLQPAIAANVFIKL